MTIKTENKTLVQSVRRKSGGLLLLWPNLLFLLTGVFLTLVAHLFLTVFVEQMVRGEYERITEGTVNSIAKEFSSIERSMNTLSILLSTSHEADATLFTKTMAFDPDMKNFEQVILLVQGESGKWQYKSLYTNPNKVYGLKVNSTLLAQVAA